jgi:hypothetical protein
MSILASLNSHHCAMTRAGKSFGGVKLDSPATVTGRRLGNAAFLLAADAVL